MKETMYQGPVKLMPHASSEMGRRQKNIGGEVEPSAFQAQNKGNTDRFVRKE